MQPGVWESIKEVFSAIWWLIVPLALGFFLWEQWLSYIKRKFVIETKQVLLEIKIPREVQKTPKAMEQVFSAFRAMYSFGFNWKQKYIKGEVELWLSLEMVGTAQGIFFYIRTPESHRNLIESAIFAQYPEVEIQKVDDYVEEIGMTLPNEAFDLWGAEFTLARDNPYPIKTYPMFEEKIEEAQLDPLSQIMEVMSRLQGGERIMIQILVKPIGDELAKEGEKLRDKIADRKKPIPDPSTAPIGNFFKDLATAPFKQPEVQEKKKEERGNLLMLTPGERSTLEAIEKKSGKLAFETLVRFVFVDDRKSFTRSHISAVMGAMHQFNTNDLNSFKPNKDTLTAIRKGFFKDQRTYLRKRKLWDKFKFRRFSPKGSYLNTEELATIFHIPSFAVKAPLLRHVPSKKGEPPAGLPIEE
ncbi:MAG: hypothetical protein COU07_00220 [Candidatus Harrisonbacteria bacterium CG10_big_fil_rev_8_21_14_0_10_40_38]|uniref:DUF8128 domain-containing protein n=1 Tax=Candidatus Harrisonbacteria bacterium CG10_big_fil_rev_8_21_14_0_10_40_38 TaxID=1974583 RepID=A0A2H0USC8_9BACT|nr:MAG: hypothetical protein COU07_00220 [Candidatus Harrisonbacteria bacterium CG10_big_fil_rev_8_21_14_0_10_40_38]